MIRIKSKRHNFRRCGIAHPAEAVDYPDDRFTKAELKILKAEPMLAVEIVPDAPAETAGKAAEPGKEPAKAGKKGKR